MGKLQIFISIYNIRYEILNTIQSCLPPYQENVNIDEYEIIIVDNGSVDGIDVQALLALSPNISYYSHPHSTSSPVNAINTAIAEHGHSECYMICVDGARMFSNKILSKVMNVIHKIPDAFIYTLGFHIGKKTHMELTKEDYSIDEAREFLTALNWKKNPDALKENSVLGGSSMRGFFSSVSESNAFVIKKEHFERVGAFDNRFTSPGGGFCNLEIFGRYVSDEKTINICLLNEGTYHQYHGGAATGMKIDRRVFRDEFEEIFGSSFERKEYSRFYF